MLFSEVTLVLSVRLPCGVGLRLSPELKKISDLRVVREWMLRMRRVY